MRSPQWSSIGWRAKPESELSGIPVCLCFALGGVDPLWGTVSLTQRSHLQPPRAPGARKEKIFSNLFFSFILIFFLSRGGGVGTLGYNSSLSFPRGSGSQGSRPVLP